MRNHRRGLKTDAGRYFRYMPHNMAVVRTRRELSSPIRGRAAAQRTPPRYTFNKVIDGNGL